MWYTRRKVIKNTISMIYTDDGILADPSAGLSADKIDEVIQLIREKYDITNEGDLSDYLGLHVTHLPDGSIQLAQPH